MVRLVTFSRVFSCSPPPPPPPLTIYYSLYLPHPTEMGLPKSTLPERYRALG